jgi:hypothetical protein
MGGEAKEGDETNRQQPKGAAFVFNLHYRKRFSSRVTFRIPVVRGKNLDNGSAHSCNPRHGATRHGVAGGGGGARIYVSLVLILIHLEKQPPL